MNISLITIKETWVLFLFVYSGISGTHRITYIFWVCAKFLKCYEVTPLNIYLDIRLSRQATLYISYINHQYYSYNVFMLHKVNIKLNKSTQLALLFWYQDETVIYVFSFSAKFMHGWKLIYLHHFIEFVEFNNIRILLCYWQWIPYCSISYVSFKLPDSGLKIKLVKIEWMNHCVTWMKNCYPPPTNINRVNIFEAKGSLGPMSWPVWQV